MTIDDILEEAGLFTRIVQKCSMWVCVILQIPLVPVGCLTNMATGCMIVLSMGIFGILFSLLWLPFFGLLIGTSWLWIRVWPLRPLLLVPGLLTVVVTFTLAALIHDDPGGFDRKAALIMYWPLSWHVMSPPVATEEAIEPWYEPPTEG